ncbi:hypothetical protein NIES4075_61130 [Tolypothrix sp. NIES-4075]|nr:hypothetical protein NIES4075_61130 [Tolypothrix sp. NIES-4075]
MFCINILKLLIFVTKIVRSSQLQALYVKDLRLFLSVELISSQFVTNNGSMALYKHKLEGLKNRQKLNEAINS